MESFASVMREWLYGREGYYRRAQIGKEGDFYTSVSVGGYFGASIAEFLVRFLQEGRAGFVELGASRGELISDVAEYVRQYYPKAFKEVRWVIVEPLEELRSLQRFWWESRLKGVELEIYSSLEELRDSRLFFVANELFDAFPCELYREGEQGFVNEHGEVVFAMASEELRARAKAMNMERGELGMGVREFVDSLRDVARDWLFLTFDYGEDYARNEFSVRIFKDHHVLSLNDFMRDIRPFFGVSDLTSDVNFAELTSFFERAGARRIYFARENRALLQMGLMRAIEQKSAHLSPKEHAKEMIKVRSLLDPGLLGERFKCACFTKGECVQKLFLTL